MENNQNKQNEKEDRKNLLQNPINKFTCCNKIMDFTNFKKHLIEDHKLNENQFKGKKQMTLHIDGSYWFSSTYEWELESGLKFTQYIKMARDKGNFYE